MADDTLAPDPLKILGQHLRSSTLVTALVGQRSSLILSTTLPAIRYAVAANPKTGPDEWAPSAQIECWANDDAAASDLARAAAASINDLPGARSTGLVAEAEVTNIFSSPDPDTHRPRVIVLVALLVYATDEVETP
jgi:hypothetical protein